MFLSKAPIPLGNNRLHLDTMTHFFSQRGSSQTIVYINCAEDKWMLVESKIMLCGLR